MKFARTVFYIAGVYGLIVLAPQYFLEEKNGRDFPPAITHPEYYYGFIGVALAFQVLFLIIARNPVRYRAAMIPAMIEKFSFVIAAVVLFLQNRIPLQMFGAAMIDLILGALFIAAFLKTERKDY
jgi:drug/metabolite transporter (DMT)-like permease